ncbi:MAG: 30S ribosomal protein S16 [Candidatus Gracilibacteria bacterium]
MLKIRLSRVGKKNQPSFRVIVQEHTSAVKGKFIEELGYYRPATKDKELVFKLDRVKYWIGNGAQPSDTVAVLLKKQGVSGMEKFIALRNRQKKSKKVVPEAAAKPATPAAPATPETPATPAQPEQTA